MPCVHCRTQCPPNLQQATAHASSGDSWILKGKSGSVLVGSLLFSPGSWCTQGSVCARQESVSQSCRSSGSSVVGLMATSSKTAYAIPRSTTRRAPALAAVHCWPVPPQETVKHSSVSVSVGFWVLVCTRLFWALWASLAGMVFDSKCNFAPPTVLLGLLRHQKKHILLLYWLCQRLWLGGSQQTGKFLKRWEYQNTWPASWEICIQVKGQAPARW